MWLVLSCGSKNNLILQSLFSHFYECCILFFFPTVQARCSFFLQNNNTSFEWSAFFEAQRVEAFSISLAISNQLLEALACVINFAANMGQLKHIPIQRSHLLSIPLGRKGNEMCLLCSAEAREWSRSWKKTPEFLAGKKTSFKRKPWENLTPRSLPAFFSKSLFSSRLWVQPCLLLAVVDQGFPFCCLISVWKAGWEWKKPISNGGVLWWVRVYSPRRSTASCVSQTHSCSSLFSGVSRAACRVHGMIVSLIKSEALVIFSAVVQAVKVTRLYPCTWCYGRLNVVFLN